MEEHYCTKIEDFPITKFLQRGIGRGEHILVVGESPAPNGWRVSGKAFYTIEGKLLPTGKRLNELLRTFDLSVETCGFTELAKCIIGKNRHKLKNCSQKTWPIFTRQLSLLPIKLIILLGVKTTEIFNKLAKTELSIGQISKIVIDNNKYVILPIYHPSPINPHGRKKNQAIFGSLSQEINSYF